MFADPPSVIGIEGPQMVEGAPGAPAAGLAAWVEVSSPSPGSSRGDWELREDAVIPLVLPPADADPLTVEPVVAFAADPVVVPDVVEGVELVEVDTSRGSDPTVVVPVAV
jgi:hypothetical protein